MIGIPFDIRPDADSVCRNDKPEEKPDMAGEGFSEAIRAAAAEQLASAARRTEELL